MPKIRYVGPVDEWVAPAPLPLDEQPPIRQQTFKWGFRGRLQQQPGGQPDAGSVVDEGQFLPAPMQIPRVPPTTFWGVVDDDIPLQATGMPDEGDFRPPVTSQPDRVIYLWLGDDVPPFLIDEDHPAPKAVVWPRYQVPIVYLQAEDDLPPQPHPLEEDSFVALPPPVRFQKPLEGFRADDVLGFVTTLPVEEDQYFPRVMSLPDPTAAIRAIGKEGWEWLRQAVGALGYRFTILAQLNYRFDILPGGVTVPGTLYIGTDNLLRIRGLQNLASGGSYENAASVSATVADVAGTTVGNAVAMPYVAGSDGVYEGTFTDAVSATLTEYGEYLVTTTAICPDGLEVTIKRRCIARYKS